MSSSRRAESKIEAGQRLVPLTFERDNHSSDLLELIEPERDRQDLMLSARNDEIFATILNEFRHNDALRRHGLKNRSKLLFCGPPGCGKTIGAEVLARQLGLPLFIVRIDAIISSFLGETASNIRKLFESANHQACVLFLDEFDALARARAADNEHNELRRVVNSLLMMIDRYKGRGFLIAATNLEEVLDSAIWRRFDDVLFFGLPHASEIRDFLKLKTRNFPADFEIEKKATKLKGLSYGDIERVCFDAIKRAVLKQTPRISEKEFDTAIQDERRRQAIRSRLNRNPNKLRRHS